MGWTKGELTISAQRESKAETTPFVTWLGACLAREGLTQTEAARRVGVTSRTLNRWVLGQSEPTFRHLRRICEAFGPPPIC